VNQLVIAIAARGQAGELTRALTDDGFYVTQVDSGGGITHEATVSLVIGLDRTRLHQLLEHIRRLCSTRTRYVSAHLEVALIEALPLAIETQVGGATIYLFDVERFEQI
jgi:uncharacterized protein YaaQ